PNLKLRNSEQLIHQSRYPMGFTFKTCFTLSQIKLRCSNLKVEEINKKIEPDKLKFLECYYCEEDLCNKDKEDMTHLLTRDGADEADEADEATTSLPGTTDPTKANGGTSNTIRSLFGNNLSYMVLILYLASYLMK
ncbi:hypothetical protein L9F63_021335, partial [Diploptera punctata]